MKNRNKWELLLIPVLAIAIYFIYQAVKVDDLPPDADAEYRQAVQLIQQNKLKEAKALLEEGMKKHPGEGKYDFQLGNIARKSNQPAEAIEHYQQALKSTPALVEAYNNLAAMQMQGNKLDEALQTIEAGIAQDPGFQDLHFKKGQILYVKGAYGQAVEELKPLAASPDYPEAARFLGLSLAKANLHAEALAVLKEYANRAKPETPGLAEVQAVIKQLESK